MNTNASNRVIGESDKEIREKRENPSSVHAYSRVVNRIT